MDKSYIKMSIPGLDASLENVCVCECGDALKFMFLFIDTLHVDKLF